MDFGLRGKRALVMASSRGLGLGCAEMLAADGVTVNMLLPGRSHTERVDELDAAASERTGKSLGETRTASRATTPAGRYGTVAEFASVCAFLASTHASYVTGGMIRCDGGAIKSV